MPGFTGETPGGAAATPSSALPGGNGTTGAGASSVAVYHDDAEPLPGQSLDLVSDDDLRDQEKVRLDFGRRLAGLVGLRNVQIKVIQTLSIRTSSHPLFIILYTLIQ